MDGVGWLGVGWGGVGLGRVGKGRVGFGLGVGEGVYMELGKVGSVGMWVWVGGVGLLPPPNPNSTIPYSTLSPLQTPTSPLPFPLLHDPILLARVC